MSLPNHPDTTANSGQSLPDPVVFNTKPGSSTIILASIVMLPIALLTLYSALSGNNETGVRIIGACIGGAFFFLWVFLLIRSLSIRSSFVAIGSMGINRHHNGDQWIRWEEIGAVGISVLYAQAPIKKASHALAEAILPLVGTKIVIRLRIAGSTPGLPHRPDLKEWRTHDEPSPYTHKVLLPRSPMETLEHLSSVEQAHAALIRYAGVRYTGVDYRKTIIGRYS